MTVPEHEHVDLELNIEELATKIIGPKKSEFAGGGRYEEDGLIQKVEDLAGQVEEIRGLLGEGGVKIRLPVPLWVAIVTALGGLLVQLLQSTSVIP